MRHRRGTRLAAIGGAVSLLASLTLLAVAGGADAGSVARPSAPTGTAPTVHAHRAVCGPVRPGRARCIAEVLERGDGVRPDTATSPTGLSPATMAAAYGFPADGGAGTTIAIVDAYNDPTVQSDLNAFDSQYGLSCNSCFSEAVESGGITTDPGWALEISLDVEWAHAMAPAAHILLVEALDSTYTNLLAAEDYASANAQYVSNSWIGGEFAGENTYDTHFSYHPNISYFFASGDNGSGVGYPSASPDVISVGGTTLHFNTSGNVTSETAWSGSGGGCSAYEPATTSQSSFSQYGQVNCGGARATPDVAFDADPNSGASVYDSTPDNGYSGWWTVGGTSLATPMWAARAADSGSPVSAATVYGNGIPFRDITSGSNGYPALVGYDLATGRGSWAAPVAVTLPGPPTSLTATGGTGKVTLGWSAATSGGPAQSFNVYRATSAGAEGTVPYATGVAAASFTDAAVTPGVTYYYEVTAVNSAGESGKSTEAAAAASDELPTASFTKSCGGATCTFTSTSSDPDGSIAKFVWTGGNNLTGSASKVSHTYTTTGTFSVTLTVTDSSGQSASAQGSVSCSRTRRGTSCR